MGEKKHAVYTLSLFLVTLAVYFPLCALLRAGGDPPVYYYGRLIELLSILLFAALAVATPMKFADMGIVVPRGLLLRSLSAGVGIALAFAALLAAAAAFFGHAPLFSFAVRGDISRATYILVAPLQEVLGKSAMYYSFELCFDRAHPHLANGLCAVTFALFHAVYGPRMMLLAALLSLVTGWLFQKYRCVWGCAAVHFALGFLPPCFGF